MAKFQIEVFKADELEPRHTTVIYAPDFKAAEKTADKMRASYECASYNVTEYHKSIERARGTPESGGGSK